MRGTLNRGCCEYESQIKINDFVVMFVLQVHWSILTPGLQSSFKQVKHNVNRYLNRRDRFKIMFVLVKSSNFVKSVQALL